jgi:phospholipid/cholesterol/gamma-HCH transport system permease protein
MLQALGHTTLRSISEIGNFALFTSRAAVSSFGAPRLGRRLVRAVHEQGVRCLPVVLIVGLFVGLVFGLQVYHLLALFGATSSLGNGTSLSLVRELAPVFTALMLVAQAGSAMAAEIGIQRNREEIDALETMGIDPHRYLVAPRLLASVVVFPMQTALFMLIGLIGGYISGCILLPLEPSIYWSRVMEAVNPADVRECFTKALCFGVITTAICCHNGFNAHLRRGLTGAQAVSASTIRAVVFACIAILLCDYLITAALV